MYSFRTVILAKKAIATTRAFGKKTSEIKYIEEAVSTYAVRCAETLRKQNSIANILTVFIHTDPFNLNVPQLNKSKTITFPVATNNNIEIVKFALYCLHEIFEADYSYKKAGVIVDGLQSDTAFQGNGKEWKLKQEKLSKRYTTNWDEIIEVKN